MKTETVPIDSVRPDPRNARRHGPPNLAAIRASLEAFGQQKPIVVDAEGIVRAGNGTLEPFGGSGTQIIAAEQIGRRCAAIEIDPRWCDAIVKRWEQATGERAERVRQD